MIMLVIGYAAVPVGLFAFVHALIQRPDAFTAASKRTKPFWLGVTAAATVACGLCNFSGPLFILWIAGLVAALVYIVDVRPKVIEVQRGS